MQNQNNDISNTIAVLALILAILSLVVAAVGPVLGPLTGLVLAAFLGGGATFVWADRRFPRRDKLVAPRNQSSGARLRAASEPPWTPCPELGTSPQLFRKACHKMPAKSRFRNHRQHITAQ